MKFSFRRVASTLVIVSIVTFGISYVATGVSVCYGLHSCAAAVTLSGFDTSVQTPAPSTVAAQTTQSMIQSSDPGATAFPVGAEITALYLLVFGLAVLIVMEFSKPHFLRMFASHRRQSR